MPEATRLAVVGRGRLGTALTAALTAAGYDVTGPHGRGFDGHGFEGRGFDGHGLEGPGVERPGVERRRFDGHPGAVLLCVPDGEIKAAASLIAPGPLVGHCSGATTLAPLAPHEAFSLHPLMT